MSAHRTAMLPIPNRKTPIQQTPIPRDTLRASSPFRWRTDPKSPNPKDSSPWRSMSWRSTLTRFSPDANSATKSSIP